jgi:Big-like domain-containing protein
MKPHRVPIVLVCLSFLSGCGAGTLGPGISAPPRTLVSIAITPANAGVLLGTLQQFTATGTYSDHSSQDITDSVTWSSSDINVASSDGLSPRLGYNFRHFRFGHRKHDVRCPACRPNLHRGPACKQENRAPDQPAVPGDWYVHRRKHSQCDPASVLEIIEHCRGHHRSQGPGESCKSGKHDHYRGAWFYQRLDDTRRLECHDRIRLHHAVRTHHCSGHQVDLHRDWPV